LKLSFWGKFATELRSEAYTPPQIQKLLFVSKNGKHYTNGIDNTSIVAMAWGLG